MEKKLFATNDGFKLEHVTEPFLGKNDVLIEVHSSFFSPGTEKASLNKIQASIFKKAFKFRKQVQTLLRDGDYRTLFNKIKSQSDIQVPSGYSLFGKVLKVGEEVTSVRAGQYVVGVGDKANHGTIAVVPQGLLVPCSYNLDYAGSALVAIALNALEISKFKPFSRICILGGGLLGQLLVQLCSHAGYEVDVFDPNSTLNDISIKNGANCFLIPSDLRKRNNSYQGAIITAPRCTLETWSNLAGSLQVGSNIVLVGAADLNVSRQDFYQKRLNFLTAYSYGAGREEYCYEVHNLQSRLNTTGLTPVEQLVKKSIKLIERNIVSFGFIEVVDFTSDTETSDDFQNSGAIAYLFKWNADNSTLKSKAHVMTGEFETGSEFNGMDVLGHSAYFRDSHRRGLKKNGIKVNKIMNRSPLPLKNDLLTKTNAILISTPHDEHWTAIKNAKNYRYIFVDKPILTKRDEYQEYINEASNVLALMSRRYSDYTMALKNFINSADSAVQTEFNFCVPTKDGGDPIYYNGGRIIGEMCHHIDLAIYINGPVEKFETINFDNALSITNQERLFLFLLHENGNSSIIKYWPENHPYFDKEMIYATYRDVYFLIEDFKNCKSNFEGLINFKTNETDKGCVNMWSRIKSEIFTNGNLAESWKNIDKQVYDILFRIGM